jgi:hypothetical protein
MFTSLDLMPFSVSSVPGLISLICSCYVIFLFQQLPGFRVFMIEKFATGCCLYSVLDKSFNLRDANTVIILQFLHVLC